MDVLYQYLYATGITPKNGTASSSDFNFTTSDGDANSFDAQIEFNDTNEIRGNITIPVQFIDDNIPEKDESLVLYIDTRYNEMMTTGEFVLVKIIDDDTTGKTQ